MPTKNPRINIVLEKPLYNAIKKIAKKEGISVSLKARDFIREALETHEDALLDEIASDREKSFSKEKAQTHEDIWS
ncbi:MAG: antitoxin, RHH family protein [Candidatus Dadabacteria bacterium]|nr:antitoxin, RHH family protein [Candidatus Dadabacteria bacterium]NIV42095.1 antitoxin, RHH family protein [Candidatus Dadabacteria bacterium]NIX16424.1 antitoxin, RHH family protein [Candidatus Dadabacteria bacterium]